LESHCPCSGFDFATETLSVQEQAAGRRAASAQRACRREEQRVAQGGVNARQVRLAVAIFVLSGYDASIAEEYILSKSESVADPGTLVQDLHLAMPLDSALRLCRRARWSSRSTKQL